VDGVIVSPVLAVLLMALVTYLTRAVPMVFFRREIRSPYVKTFFHYMPFAVLGALTFPDVFTATGSVISSVVGCTVAVLLAFRGKSMIFVTVCAITVMYILELVV
jgi:branched-subunit amino acid transport protein